MIKIYHKIFLIQRMIIYLFSTKYTFNKSNYCGFLLVKLNVLLI